MANLREPPSWALCLESSEVMTENEKKVVLDALEKARHALVTNQGAFVTDRPDLVGKRPLDAIGWPIDESAAIQAIDEAIQVLVGS